jgi:methylated-DNA-[protein]-cysteine S-methyltransferase
MSARSSGPVLATVLDTPAGPLSLLAHADTLVGAGFTGDPGSLHARLEPALRAAPLTTARPQDLAWLVKPMRDYFDGDLKAPDGLPVRQPGSPGRQRLWDEMRAVPAGTTITYTELAARAGQPRAPRAAGAACAANLIAPVIPCHRILRSDGTFGGYYYGVSCKEWLLAHERAHLLVPPPCSAFPAPSALLSQPPRSAPTPALRSRPRPAPTPTLSS